MTLDSDSDKKDQEDQEEPPPQNRKFKKTLGCAHRLPHGSAYNSNNDILDNSNSVQVTDIVIMMMVVRELE